MFHPGTSTLWEPLPLLGVKILILRIPFLFIALCAAATLAFGLWRQAATPPVPLPDQQNFQIVPRTTPMAALLDPNTSDGLDE